MKAVDAEITSRASRDRYVELLLSMTGVDVFAALVIRSEIGDVSRFSSYKKLICWAGLAPSLHQSGSVEYHGRITKQCSRMLRRIMVGVAQAQVHKYDISIMRAYNRIAERKGRRIAVVVAARRLLMCCYSVLRNKRPYHDQT